MKKFYAVVPLTRKVVDKTSTKKETVDVIITSEFNTRISAINDLEEQASKLGSSIKYQGAFK